MGKKPFLKISAHFHLHNMPDGYKGLLGEQINFNHKGNCTLSTIIVPFAQICTEYFERGNLSSHKEVLEELKRARDVLNNVVAQFEEVEGYETH